MYYLHCKIVRFYRNPTEVVGVKTRDVTYVCTEHLTMYFAVALIFLGAVKFYDLPGSFSFLKRSHPGLKGNGECECV
jgi:hypothetical protein